MTDQNPWSPGSELPPLERADEPRPTLHPVTTPDDVLGPYRGTPIESLLLAQNLGVEFEFSGEPQLVVATCIDPRIDLRLPPGSAFIIRTAGVNLKDEALFQFGFLTSVMGLRHVALIAHEDCAMTRLHDKRQTFVDRLVERTGCDARSAELYFDDHVDFWNVPDAITVVRDHAENIRRGGGVVVAPLFYSLREGRLLQIE